MQRRAGTDASSFALSAASDVPAVQAMIAVFDTVILTAFLLLVFILLAAIAGSRRNKVYRISGWYSFIAAWTVCALSFSLLLGKQTGQQPSYNHCLFQASFSRATPAL